MISATCISSHIWRHYRSPTVFSNKFDWREKLRASNYNARSASPLDKSADTQHDLYESGLDLTLHFKVDFSRSNYIIRCGST